MTRAMRAILAALTLALAVGSTAWAGPNDGPGDIQQCQQDCGPVEPEPEGPDDVKQCEENCGPDDKGPDGFKQCEQNCGPDEKKPDPDPDHPETDGATGQDGSESSHGPDVVVATPSFTG